MYLTSISLLLALASVGCSKPIEKGDSPVVDLGYVSTRIVVRPNISDPSRNSIEVSIMLPLGATSSPTFVTPNPLRTSVGSALRFPPKSTEPPSRMVLSGVCVPRVSHPGKASTQQLPRLTRGSSPGTNGKEQWPASLLLISCPLSVQMPPRIASSSMSTSPVASWKTLYPTGERIRPCWSGYSRHLPRTP
jgi:hypothetical protein